MKELRITSSKIVVSSNHLSPKGYYVFHKVTGILPGCRKVATLTYSPMVGKVWVRNLWSYNGSADINPEQWAELVKSSPVVTERLDSTKIDLTPEVVEDAYQDALRITNCPAVTDRSDYVRSDFQPKYDDMVVVTHG